MVLLRPRPVATKKESDVKALERAYKKITKDVAETFKTKWSNHEKVVRTLRLETV